MDDPELLTIPRRLRNVVDALGVAVNVDLRSVVILGETPDGMVLLSAGNGDALTSAEVLWLLIQGLRMIVNPAGFSISQRPA